MKNDNQQDNQDQDEELKKPNNEDVEANGIDLKDTLQRLQAEFENYKKRTERELQAAINRGIASFIFELLPVIDDIERALVHSDDEGYRHIHEKIISTLASHGVKQFAAQGKPFDPTHHEAIMIEKTTNKDNHNTVKEVFEQGYTYHDRVIRHAKVKVEQYEEDTNGKDNRN